MGKRWLAPLAVGLLAAWGAAPASAAPPVTNTNDSGAGSLRAAIAGASNGDTISVPAGLYTLSTGPLQIIGVNLTIVGAGQGLTTISGANAQQVFTTSPGGPTVVLRGMTLTAGKAATFGGAILATGPLTLDHVAVTNSAAGTFGGGVDASGHSLTVTDSTFTGDTAGGGSTGFGGAIFFGSSTSASGDAFTMTIERSTFAGDFAGGGGGTGFGGAVEFGPAASGSASNVNFSAQISDSTFAGDFAGGGGGTGFGGGLMIGPSDTGTNSYDVFSARLTRDDFSGDGAAASGGGTGFGGGAAFAPGTAGANDASSLTVASSRFADDVAAAGSTGFGGGLSATVSGGVLRGSVVATTFARDSAASGSTGFGGGLQLSESAGVTGAFSLENDTFAGNQVAAGSVPPFGGFGGGVELLVASGAVATLLNDTITGNSAGGTGHGGGLSLNGPVAVTNSIVAGNAGAAGTDCDSPPSSAGGNIEGATSCGFTAPGDRQNTPAGLGPLQDNGGTALPDGSHPATLAPLSGSPAISGALGGACPAADARGVPRPLGSGCDVGALEVVPPSASTGGATSAQTTSATVLGSVVANDAGASWFVRYGTTTAYGSTTAAATLAPGGSPVPVQAALSGLKPATTYHYQVLASDGPDTSLGADATFTTAAATPPTPVISKAAQSHRLWRAGKKLARISRRAKKPPVGTTFSFSLNERASVTFSFTQRVSGRRVGRRCVPRTRANARRRSCSRMVAAGALGFIGHAGANRIAFQGRLSRTKQLKPGSYTLIITAANSAGARSRPVSLSFTIVR